MANKILLQTLLRFSDDIKSGAAKVQDVITDYFNQTGKSVTDEERGIILKEFQDNAPSNVTTLEGVDPVETIMPMGGARSKTPFTDKVREQNPGVEIRGDETFGELTEMFPFKKSKIDVSSIFGKPKEVVDLAEGKRAATTLARAADMAADTKVKQELLANLDDDIANYGPDWWKGMGYNEGPMGRESVGNLLESMTTEINNGVIDDLIAQGIDEDKAFEIFRYMGRDELKFDPKGFIRKVADELEFNDIKYDMTFWDNYVDEILTRIQKPEPRFADGGLV